MSCLRPIWRTLLLLSLVVVCGCSRGAPKDNPENWKVLKRSMPYVEVREILGKPDVDESHYRQPHLQAHSPGGLTGKWYYNLRNGEQFALRFSHDRLVSVERMKPAPILQLEWDHGGQGRIVFPK